METIRCCIACILPCGALDVIRIVHANGRVEEIGGTVSAGEIMKAYPKHVLRKPPTVVCTDDFGVVQKPAVVLPPSAVLQKGKIYFLTPVLSSSSPSSEGVRTAVRASPKKKRKKPGACGGDGTASRRLLLANERYLSELMMEDKAAAAATAMNRDRRRGRVAVWRPHLESITEDDF